MQNNYPPNANTSLPNGPPLRGTPPPQMHQNGPNMGAQQVPFTSNGPPPYAGPSPPSNPGMTRSQQGMPSNTMQQRSTPPSSRQNPSQTHAPQHAVNKNPSSVPQMHPTSAFTPVIGSHSQPQQLMTPPSGPPQQPTSTVLTTPSSSSPATLPVSSDSGQAMPTSQSRSQRSTPSPQPYSALHSGKPKRPGMPVGPGSTYPGQQGIPQRPTPQSSGPPTPSDTPSPNIQGSVPPAGFPGPGQDSSAGRPSMMSKRRLYPTQVKIG